MRDRPFELQPKMVVAREKREGSKAADKAFPFVCKLQEDV